MEYGGTLFGMVALAVFVLLIWGGVTILRRRGRGHAYKDWSGAHPTASIFVDTFVTFWLTFGAGVLAFDHEPGEALEGALGPTIGVFLVESFALGRRRDEDREASSPDLR
jgi:hypothetical protein